MSLDWMDVFREHQPVGSRVTCTPPPADTDEDFLVLAADAAYAAQCLEGFGFTCSSKLYTDDDGGTFRSWRRGGVNLITTPSHEFYQRFLLATALAKRFNLLDKADRIALFQGVLYSKNVDDPEPAILDDGPTF